MDAKTAPSETSSVVAHAAGDSSRNATTGASTFLQVTTKADQAQPCPTADTPATWRGERMDYSWAIDSLLRRDNRIDSVLGLESRADSRADNHPDSHPADSIDNQPPLPAAWLS